VVVTKFRGLAGPKGIPDDIAAQWERAIRQVVASDAYKAEYAKESLVPNVLGRAEARIFTQKFAEDITATLRELGVIK
jgi:tripartite-type tricarboxylate transporter receptor subunit TctC